MSLMTAHIDQAPILVLAVGNPSRGDDAFGPILAQRLQDWLHAQTPQTQQAIDIITDQQLVVEHALDLQDRRHVLFIDAAVQQDDPVALKAVTFTATPGEQPNVDSHRSTPSGLLNLYQTLLKLTPPCADLLTLTGHDFELGAPLSARAQSHLPQAWTLLTDWLCQALSAVSSESESVKGTAVSSLDA